MISLAPKLTSAEPVDRLFKRPVLPVFARQIIKSTGLPVYKGGYPRALNRLTINYSGKPKILKGLLELQNQLSWTVYMG